MKKLISVLVIVSMLLASVITVIPAFADDDIILDEKNESVTSGNLADARLFLFEKFNTAKALVLTDYTESTAQKLNDAIEYATTILDDENSEYELLLEAISLLDDAFIRLKQKNADLSQLKLFYTECKYSDTVTKYRQTELATVIEAIEKALSNENILISEVEAIENMINGITRVELIASAEEFMAMKSDGSYVLIADIELNESYGEFSGYLHGNRHTVTVTDGAIFNSLNGATVIGLEINGNISSAETVGVLANEVSGTVRVTNVVNNATVSAELTASGFIAESKGANIFFNGCINNANINGSESAGFVSKNVGEKSGNILFEYCASLGNLSGKRSASAFFGMGNSNIEMYGCIAGGEKQITVTIEDAENGVGGIIGDICGVVDINACYFNIEVLSNKENSSAALIIGGQNLSVGSLKNVFARGKVVALGNNTYRLTSNSADKLTLDTVMLDVSLMTYIDGSAVENPNAIDTTEKTDMLSFDRDSVNEANYGTLAFILSVTSDADTELKVESAQMFIDSLKMFKTPEQAELDREKAEIKKAIQIDLKPFEDYTASSYAAYLADIEKLISDIDVADKETLAALDYLGIIDLAEKKLITLEEEKLLTKQAAFEAAKKVALAILSAKKENVGKLFTQESYSAYLKAFDSIVEKINSVADISELEELDVPALKVAAENLLVVYVQNVVEEEDNGDSNYEKIEFEEDEKNENANVQNAAPAESNSCASSVSLSALAAVLSIGTALVIKKNKIR